MYETEKELCETQVWGKCATNRLIKRKINKVGKPLSLKKKTEKEEKSRKKIMVMSRKWLETKKEKGK